MHLDEPVHAQQVQHRACEANSAEEESRSGLELTPLVEFRGRKWVMAQFGKKS
jgi:hypothetical protein